MVASFSVGEEKNSCVKYCKPGDTEGSVRIPFFLGHPSTSQTSLHNAHPQSGTEMRAHFGTPLGYQRHGYGAGGAKPSASAAPCPDGRHSLSARAQQEQVSILQLRYSGSTLPLSLVNDEATLCLLFGYLCTSRFHVSRLCCSPLNSQVQGAVL